MASNGSAQPSNSQLRSTPSRWNWVSIATVAIMAIALVYQISQTKLLEDQLERQFAEPILRAQAFHRAGERIGLTEARDSIVEEFLLKIEERKEQDPQLSYVEIIPSVLPISRALGPAPIRIDISVENIGNAPAENVAVSVEWQGEIIAIDAESLADWSETEGGLGESEVTIWLQRIAKGETARISVEYAAYIEAKDALTLSVNEPRADGASASWPVSAAEDFSFPAFRIEGDETVIDYDAIDVVVGSDKTSVQVVEVEPLFSGYLIAFQEAAKFLSTPEE